MEKQLIKVISSSFYGEWVHNDPKKALIGLNPVIAGQKPNNSIHSCWELLYHIVIWQEAIIRQITGENVD